MLNKGKTIDQVLMDQGIDIQYRKMTENGSKFLLGTMMSDSFLDEVMKDDEYINSFYTQVLLKRIKAFKLEEVIDTKAVAMHLSFDLDTPGEIIIFLIKLFEWGIMNNTLVTHKDVIGIFANGFYDKKTVELIIDKCMHTKLSLGSEIYGI